ncbi:uncharacterized protein LOC119378986 [Rhipicephalus sanguineus]|nr:uncharacterized protein LOC119378986 [Rhipicephalus sanguineus]
MRAALKHGHIVREREGKAQVKDADAEVKDTASDVKGTGAKVKGTERSHPCPEWKRKVQSMTLEEVRQEHAKCEKRLQEHKEEKHQLFAKLKKVLEKEDAARHRELNRKACQMAAVQAAAACTHANMNKPAVSAVGQVGQAQPFYNQSYAPVPYTMINPQSSTAVITDSSSLYWSHTSSPAQSLYSQAVYSSSQYTYWPQVNGYGSTYVHYPPVVPSGTQQASYGYAAQNVFWGSGSAGLPNNNAAALASPFNTQPSTSRS